MSGQQAFQGKQAVVCGGSRGIGLETARAIVRQGGSVCLVARNAQDLAAAATEIAKSRLDSKQHIEVIACDTSDADSLRPLLEDYVQRRGVPDYLINNVGFAYPQYVQKLTLGDFRRHMDVNYYGQLVPLLLLLPYFMRARKGHVATVSSMLGFMGMIGYAAYSPTKFALVGLTESLRNELKPHGIRFSVLYPPDTDTDGFKKENQSKPEETRLMSGSVKLMSAAAVADVFVRGLLKKQYAIMPAQARWVWRLQRYFPWLVRWVLDRDYNKARRQTAPTSLTTE
jgi:3-dehydrosphinganine reductase